MKPRKSPFATPSAHLPSLSAHSRLPRERTTSLSSEGAPNLLPKLRLSMSHVPKHLRLLWPLRKRRKTNSEEKAKTENYNNSFIQREN